MNNQGITFQAIFNKATTTVDGAWNVTFSVSQDEAKKIVQLSTLRDTNLQLAVIPIYEDSSGSTDDFLASTEEAINDSIASSINL